MIHWLADPRQMDGRVKPGHDECHLLMRYVFGARLAVSREAALYGAPK
jgi:hypothetical protein